MLLFHVIGPFKEHEVSTSWAAETRPAIAEVEALIDAAWTKASQRPGVHLFDGPMCRLERWHAGPGSLRLELSPTSYKIFVGTNLAHADLADRFGKEVLANAVGMCAAIETSDNFILLGRRSARQAHYPNRIHPFGGCLEPDNSANVFDEIRRELREELGFEAGDISELVCAGLVEDTSIRQPELVFLARTRRTKTEVQQTLDASEHSTLWSLPASEEPVSNSLNDPMLTPVGRSALLLWGRLKFGEAWNAEMFEKK